MEIKLKVKDLDQSTFQVVTIGDKTVYSPDNSSAEWVREEIRGIKTEDAPQMTSAIGVKTDGATMCGKLIQKALGYFFNGGNNIESNGYNISLLSSCYSMGHGLSILPSNFQKVLALFAARKSIMPNWINCKDEYMVPNTQHPYYQQWNKDAIVYALFNVSSQQSSLRDIEYKGKKWDILNHFFFMSNTEMMELANVNGFNEMYQDAKRFNVDRYVFTLLQSTTLSDDAREVLGMAMELIRKSFSMRIMYNQDHPEYHLSAWDAGWAQLKPMFKEYFKDDYDKFVEKYKSFEDRMRQGVYTFGFLK